ncbi:hypothetical protein H2198_004361 [Neophaeococcomyces mojaviensis]|uniref:Uncharacterized protein n=1 Tax=Neophaeococcomyces mojaviensis TaxID=3383035 RepID=A0ACC3A966_9EURO|nr:hypothetical protein H2198_004361 [Knufia sp. JES_112]
MSSGTAVDAPRREEEGGTSYFTSIARSVGIFILMQVVMRQFFSGSSSTSTSTGGPGSGSGSGAPSAVGNFADRPAINEVANYSAVPNMLSPIWADDSTLDIRVHVSSKLQLPPLASLPAESLVISEDNFKIGDWQYNKEFQTTITLPTEAQHNGSLFAHIFAGLHGYELDPSSTHYDPAKAAHYVKQLNHYIPKKKVRKERNLLEKTEETELAPEEPVGPQIASYWHPNFTLAVIPQTGVQNWRSLHPGLRKDILMEPTGARDASGQNGWYYPVFFLNTFWQLKSHMIELNETVKSVPLNINFYNMANWKYSILASMDEGMRQQSHAAAFGQTGPTGGDGSEIEKFKEILLDSNPYLLATTFVVSILHMIFEALAFKNDISHWRKKKDNVGTSFRTIIANVFMQTVIFLYLVDNSDGTSWMILASQGIGILVEAWKITKTVNVVVKPPEPNSAFSFLPYVVKFEDKHQLSELEKDTEEYDAEAFRYLFVAAVPLLLAYAIYSLKYETHKSWYSFVIETLVGSVYAYGFLMMVPQLYVNYKLKSVAHMPGKAMTYKVLSTFIDDLFAFTIRMPVLHRLATLRDDVIFFIWLYQKWIYRVDFTRVNEFGQGGDDEDEPLKDGEKKETEKPIAGQDTKELKSAVPVASASGAEKKGSAKKRK